jgi:hypothetical protein
VLHGGPGQPGYLGPGIVLRAFEHPGALVVEDEEGDIVHDVAARNRAADEVGHDVPAARLRCLAALVRQFGQRITGDAAGRERQADSSSRLNGRWDHTLS